MCLRLAPLHISGTLCHITYVPDTLSSLVLKVTETLLTPFIRCFFTQYKQYKHLQTPTFCYQLQNHSRSSTWVTSTLAWWQKRLRSPKSPEESAFPPVFPVSALPTPIPEKKHPICQLNPAARFHQNRPAGLTCQSSCPRLAVRQLVNQSYLSVTFSSTCFRNKT